MIDQLKDLKTIMECCKKWPESREWTRTLLLSLCDNFLHLAEWVKRIDCHVVLLTPKGKEEQGEPEKVVEEKEPDEPLITIREFCNSLIINGSMIILPHNILGYITNDRLHFEGCFYQTKKGSPVKVYRKKLMEKLPNYQKASKILKKFLEEQKKNGQGDQEDRKGSQEDGERSEAPGKAG